VLKVLVEGVSGVEKTEDSVPLLARVVAARPPAVWDYTHSIDSELRL
jgi:hypothetical protein